MLTSHVPQCPLIIKKTKQSLYICVEADALKQNMIEFLTKEGQQCLDVIE